MSKWADRKRKRVLLIIGVILLFAIIGAIVFFAGRKKPTCFDGIQNGTETGVDCGGSCARACDDEALNLIVWWERPFKVTKGLYNVVAYLENQNLDLGIENLTYEFRVYNRENVLISEPRVGTTFVEPNKRFAIFEPGIQTGDEEAYTVFFHILSQSDWKKVNPDFAYNLFQVTKPVLRKLRTTPQLTAKVKNTSLYRFVNVPVVVIVYNSQGNAIATSQTYIDAIGNGEEKEVFFSWPEPFRSDVARVEIIPRVNPFLDPEKAPQTSI